MRRRELLTGVSTGGVLSLTGCFTTESTSCAEETWTGVGYRVMLDDISVNETAERWDGDVSLFVDMTYVSGGNPGITNAGVAVYSESGHRLDLLALGDMTWEHVPEENRSAGNCEGYQNGGLTRTVEFSVDAFPYYFGLWYSDVRAGAPNGRKALRYGSETPSRDAVEPSDWNAIEARSPESFPPVPPASPALEEGVTDGEVIRYRPICRKQRLQVVEPHGFDIGYTGTVAVENPQYALGVDRVGLEENGETVRVEVSTREYRRPPEIACSDAFIEYTAGLSCSERSPTTINIVHRDVAGETIGERTIERNGEAS